MTEFNLTTNCGKLPEEFNLSDKIHDEYETVDTLIFTEDVKEFIRILKTYEFSKTMGGSDTEHILISIKELNELLGDKFK